MNRVAQITLLALAFVVVAFAATWVTMPTQRDEAVNPPASLFAHGLTKAHKVRTCVGGGCSRWNPTTQRWEIEAQRRVTRHTVDVKALERRVKVIFGAAAVVTLFVGLAFGAMGRVGRPEVKS